VADSFDLVVAADSENFRINLRLMRTGGGQIAARSVDFRPLPLSKKQALFDLRSYLRPYVEKGHEEECVAERAFLSRRRFWGTNPCPWLHTNNAASAQAPQNK